MYIIYFVGETCSNLTRYAEVCSSFKVPSPRKHCVFSQRESFLQWSVAKFMVLIVMLWRYLAEVAFDSENMSWMCCRIKSFEWIHHSQLCSQRLNVGAKVCSTLVRKPLTVYIMVYLYVFFKDDVHFLPSFSCWCHLLTKSSSKCPAFCRVRKVQQRRYTEKCDIYSMGVVFISIVFGEKYLHPAPWVWDANKGRWKNLGRQSPQQIWGWLV